MQTQFDPSAVSFTVAGKAIKHLAKLHLNEKLKNVPYKLREFTIANCVLSGGCFASLFHNEKVNDFDLYLKNISMIVELNNLLKEYKGLNKELVEEAYADVFVDGKLTTIKAVTLDNRLQYITMVDFQTAKQNMDYVHCTVSYDPSKDTLWLSELQFDCIQNKKLVANNLTSITAKRGEKFRSRGWVSSFRP
jgi:hypothetical protein